MILPGQKIESAVAKKDHIRRYLTHVYLDVTLKRAVATDGHVMAICPVSISPEDTAGYVSPDALKESRRQKSATLVANGALTLENGASLPRATEQDFGHYPNVDALLPPSRPDRAPDFCVDVSLLVRIAQAINIQNAKTKDMIAVWLPPKDAPRNTARCALYIEGNSDAYGLVAQCDFESALSEAAKKNCAET